MTELRIYLKRDPLITQRSPLPTDIITVGTKLE